MPTAAAGAQNGGSPPAPVINPNALDMRGTGTFGSGSAPAAGEQVVVTFGNPFTCSDPPVVLVTDTNGNLVGLGALGAVLLGSSGAWTGFSLRTALAPAAGQANSFYGFGWHAIG